MLSGSLVANISSAGLAAGPVIRPLKWWPDAALADIEAVFLNVLMAWRQAWIDDVAADAAPGCEVTVWRAHEVPVQVQTAGEWSRLVALPMSREAWVQAPEQMAEMFFAVFTDALAISVASRNNSVLMADVADMAKMDLLERITNVLAPGSRSEGASGQTACATIPAHHARLWSEALWMRLSLTPASHIVLHVGPDCAASLYSSLGVRPVAEPVTISRSSLIAVEQAIDLHRTRLSVELAPADISLGNLQDLAVGDVLVLPHSLRQALAVRNEHGANLCQAYLGQCDGMRAVELVAGPGQDAVSENQSRK